MNTSTRNSTDLSARFAALKELHDTEIHSEERAKPFPLSSLLLIYYKATAKETNWAKRVITLRYLSTWLTPISYTPGDYLAPMITIQFPQELSDMERYLPNNISKRDVVECTLLDVLPVLNLTQMRMI